jgi:formate hydrogenlyase subunit 3/multisubunit Na+/H+ antiporter MnhD subunit
MTDPGLFIAAALAVPALAALACVWRPARERMTLWLALVPLPALGAVLAGGGDASTWVLDPRLGIGLIIDRPGALLLGAAALLWSLAGAYAATYLHGTAHRGRFAVSWLLTLTGSLGVFVAADLLSFYLTFALLSLAAYGLVVHDGTPRARRAARIYLLLAVLGEVCLLLAFVLLGAAIPGDDLSLAAAAAALPGSPWRTLTLTMLIAGFGLKAGLVPLHIWLPIAHPAAPMPASAVLSGAIVKAGIIGLIRFLPWDGAPDLIASSGLADWGSALAVGGFATAFYGVAVGITQANPKTVLAYSTVSQMGLVIAVLGLGLTAADPLAVTAGTFYAVHHLLAKGALFLGVGVAAATGGWRLLPVLVPAAILALGFGGLPPTGGFLAKLAVKPILGDGWPGLLGTLSAIGSSLLMTHFLYRAAATTAPEPDAAAPLSLRWPWWLMVSAALVIPWALAADSGLGTWPAVLAAAFDWGALWSALWPVLTGAILALGLRRWGAYLPAIPEGDLVTVFAGAGRAAMTLGAALEQADTRLRQWPVAGVSLLLLTLLLWGAMLAGNG